jgi:hypothetical protein
MMSSATTAEAMHPPGMQRCQVNSIGDLSSFSLTIFGLAVSVTATGSTTVTRIGSARVARPNAICAMGADWPWTVIACATSQTRFAGAGAASHRSTQSPKLAVVRSGVEGTGVGELAGGFAGSFASFGVCAKASIGSRHSATTSRRETQAISETFRSSR